MGLEVIVNSMRKVLAPIVIASTILTASCSPPTKPEQNPQPQVQANSQTTNSNGVATFQDDQNTIIIKAEDAQTKERLENAKVGYINGKESELFLINRTSYTPHLLTLKGEKAIHTAGLIPRSSTLEGFIMKEVTGTEEKQAIENFANFHLSHINELILPTPFVYKATYSISEIVNAYEVDLNISLFLGNLLEGGSGPVSVISSINKTLPTLSERLEEKYGEGIRFKKYGFLSVNDLFGIPTLFPDFHIFIPDETMIPETSVIQPGPTDGNDTYVVRTRTYDEGELVDETFDGPHGDSSYLYFGNIKVSYDRIHTERHLALDFNIPPEIMNAREIKLQLQIEPNLGSLPGMIYFREIREPWEESTATWNTIPAGSEITQIYFDGGAGIYEADLTGSQIRYGILVSTDLGVNLRTNSSEHQTEQYRPKLILKQ